MRAETSAAKSGDMIATTLRVYRPLLLDREAWLRPVSIENEKVEHLEVFSGPER
jgi:hypothetical protein